MTWKRWGAGARHPHRNYQDAGDVTPPSADADPPVAVPVTPQAGGSPQGGSAAPPVTAQQLQQMYRRATRSTPTMPKVTVGTGAPVADMAPVSAPAQVNPQIVQPTQPANMQTGGDPQEARLTQAAPPRPPPQPEKFDIPVRPGTIPSGPPNRLSPGHMPGLYPTPHVMSKKGGTVHLPKASLKGLTSGSKHHGDSKITKHTRGRK